MQTPNPDPRQNPSRPTPKNDPKPERRDLPHNPPPPPDREKGNPIMPRRN